MFGKKAWSALGVGALLVVGCGGEAAGPAPAQTQTTTPVTESTTTQPSTTTTQAPTTTMATETDTTVAPTISAEPLESVIGATASGPGWSVQPGVYAAALDGRNVILDIEEAITYLEGDGRLDFTELDPVQSGAPEWVMLGTFVGVIPPDAAFGVPVVDVGAFVGDEGVVTQHHEAVGEPLGHPELAPRLGREVGAGPSPEGGRALPEVDGDVEHLALRDGDELALRRRVLEVEAA